MGKKKKKKSENNAPVRCAGRTAASGVEGGAQFKTRCCEHVIMDIQRETHMIDTSLLVDLHYSTQTLIFSHLDRNKKKLWTLFANGL